MTKVTPEAFCMMTYFERLITKKMLYVSMR
jgi:hypothetical protein